MYATLTLFPPLLLRALYPFLPHHRLLFFSASSSSTSGYKSFPSEEGVTKTWLPSGTRGVWAGKLAQRRELYPQVLRTVQNFAPHLGAVCV